MILIVFLFAPTVPSEPRPKNLHLVYTAKMLFGLSQMIQQKRIDPSTRILAIHTGGLQGRLKSE